MQLNAIPLFKTLKDGLSFQTARTRSLAQNIANADTPGYVPSDVANGDFAAALKAIGRAPHSAPMRLAVTQSGHLSGPAPRADLAWRAKAAPDSETTLDGNAVVLEEQVGKLTETRLAYEANLSLYQKSLGLLRLAIQSPSR